jgi:hypothetical protein
MKKAEEYLRSIQDQLEARRKLLKSGKIRLERDEAEREPKERQERPRKPALQH